MIKEFALDPEVLARGRTSAISQRSLGTRSPMRVSWKWSGWLYEAAQRPRKPVELARIVENSNRLGLYSSKGRAGGDPKYAW